MTKSNLRSWSRVSLAIVVSVTGVACDDFMKVTNPGAVEAPALADPSYGGLMVNGVLGDFQPTFAWTALFSGVFTDELRNHHSFFENPELDRRVVNDNNGTYILAVYNGLHRTRFLADSVATRLKEFAADSAGRNVQIARVLAFGGYAWTLLGEQYCETPINRSAPVPSEQLLARGLERFEEAVTVATAARASPPAFSNPAGLTAYLALTDTVAWLARVGAARAALDLSAYDAAMRQRALAHAREVPLAFDFRAHYVRDNGAFTRRLSNPFWEFITSGRWFSLTETPFDGLNDPRVPHSTTLLTAADGTRRRFPSSPSAFGTYDATVIGKPFDAVSTMRVASGLEARYVIAEAEGLNENNLAFVSERRVVGGQPPLAATTGSAEYMVELREQRSRDLYLDGHRMGDLRRYKRAYGVDLWPRGRYFTTTESYGDQECWPIPLAEQF